MMHMIGYETSGTFAQLAPILPIPDPTLRVAGNDFYVPNTLNNIVFAAGFINSVVSPQRIQIQAPSLRSTLNVDLSPFTQALNSINTLATIRMWNTPLPLVVNEPLDVYVQNAAAVMNRAFLILSDGPVKPVGGKIYTIRATATATLVTGQWVNSALVFSQTLPSGHYQCVGFRAVSTNLVAARIFFVGSPWRPGYVSVSAEAGSDWNDLRWGNGGVLGEFDNTVPPTIDFMGITDTAEVVYLDLIKTA